MKELKKYEVNPAKTAITLARIPHESEQLWSKAFQPEVVIVYFEG